MRDRRSVGILFIIMMVIATAVGGVAIGILYDAELRERRGALRDTVRLQATLLEADPDRLRPGSSPPPIEETTRISRMLGPSGSLAIGRREGDTIVYLNNPWVPDQPQPQPAPMDSQVESPMRRALAGENGSTKGSDQDGRTFLAAFANVPGQRLGVVARTYLATFRTPFVHAAGIVGAIATVLMLAGTCLFFVVGNPILRRIREGEHRFRELFENMRSGATVYEAVDAGEDFVLTGFNRGAECIEDIPREEVLGKRLSEAFPGIRGGPLFEVLRRVWRSGRPEHLQATFDHGGRVPGWRETYVYKLTSGEIVTLYDDVSDRRQAEDALRESEARWRSIIETHAQAIVIVDPAHEIRFVNRSAEVLFGQKAEELIGAPFGYPLVQGDVAEIEIIRPGRGFAYGEMRVIPMRWSGQDNSLVFIQDVSAHKRAEGDLRKLFQAIEQSPASVMITDVQGRIEYVNPKFTETTGYTYPEVVGKPPGFLRSGYTSAREYQDLWKTIGEGRVWHGEFNNRRKNGELFWELASIAPVRDGRGKITHYVAVKEDISERKTTEERLRHSQRMETIGQLTGGIAHDFNNLLAIILGNLQLLEERPGLDVESRQLIGDAVWSAERGAQLTHRLLAFARRQRLNPKLCHINVVVEEMAGLLRRTLGERIEIVEELEPDLWEAMIDRGQMESALLNLVVNARDAMPEGGTLTIATGTALLPRDLATTGEDVAPGQYVLLRVTDTGSGMAPGVVERIFEPFFTTKKFGEGSGLGLSMVYGFVRQSGGYIAVESTLGRGTSVRLYLPRAMAAAEPEELPRRPEPQRSTRSGEVILVVEDDVRVRKTATETLRKHGYDVVEAGNSEEAMRAVDQLPRLDLLFSDVVLGNGIDGSELGRRVRDRRPGTRILLTSGYARRTPGEGATGDELELLPKPYRRSELAARVREVLDRPAD